MGDSTVRSIREQQRVLARGTRGRSRAVRGSIRIERVAPRAHVTVIARKAASLALVAAWVRLRGAEGLGAPSEVARLPSAVAQAHAINVAGKLRAMERGGALPIDAPLRIARAIHVKLWRLGSAALAREACPAVTLLLDDEIRRALERVT